MKRRFFVTIASVQALGAIAWLTNAIAPDPMGKPLWIIGFLALLPGNLMAPPLVEDLLWSAASLGLISVADLAASIAVNVSLAALCLFAFVRLRRAT